MTSRRRTIAVLVAILLVVGLAAYEWWRLAAIGRQGWAGLSYMPVVTTSKGKTVKLDFGPFSQGSVMYTYPGGPAEQAGMRRGNQILSIDGTPLRDGETISRHATQQVRNGSIVVYRTKADNVVSDHRVRFGSPTEVPLFVGLFATTQLVALTFLVIGTFVFWRRPTDSRAVVFYAMTLVAAVAMSSSALAQVDGQNLRGIAVQKPDLGQLTQPLFFAFIGFFFAPLLLHLALIFPKPRPAVAKRGRTLFTWIYGFPLYVCVCIALIIGLSMIPRMMTGSSMEVVMAASAWVVAAIIAAAAVVSLLRLIIGTRNASLREALIERPMATMTTVLGVITLGIYFALREVHRAQSPAPFFIVIAIAIPLMFAAFATYPIATFVSLLRSYRESNAEERRQVKWPLWATMVAVGGKVILGAIGLGIGSLVMLRSDISVPGIVMSIPDALSRLLYVLVPISFAFAILKYRLMNIDVIIRRTVLYTIFSAIVFVLYAGLVAGLGTLLVHFAGMKNTTMVITSTIVVALVAVPLRTRLQRMVDRNLFRERRDYPLALRNIGGAIGGGAIESFLRYAAEQVQQAMQSRFVAIALRGESQYIVSAKVGLADELVGTVRIDAASIDLTRVLDAERDQLPAPLRRLGTALVVPVSVHRDPLGLIAIGSKLSDQAISSDDLEFLTSAASQIALGIENARLRTEEGEYAQARAIQQVLLPTQFPRLDGFQISGKWQPAHSVGGDYFDTLALGDGKAAVCIADVAGKGMPAALLMANLQAAVKATAGPEVSPSRLCDKVKRVVGDNLSGGKFISFFYGILDAPARTITYTNAGHNPPILVRASGAIERLTVGGPAFCRLMRDDAHEEGTAILAPGDRLVLFTDGVSEAWRGEEEFGEDRLAALIAANRNLSVHDLQEKIIDELTSFTSGNFSDDVTLVVIAAD